jgi:hypothetical protein
VELLAEVLQLVPLRQRLTVCALVCSSWRDAAARVTTDLTFLTSHSEPLQLEQPQIDSLVASWLPRHGQHVIRLSLRGFSTWSSRGERPSLGVAPLACPRLQSLDLTGCTVQLHVLQGCSSLTRLCLGYHAKSTYAANAFPGAPRSFTALAHLTALQHLECVGDAGEGAAIQEFPAGVLSHLVHLTHLRLSRFNIDGAALERLSTLSGLQHLTLGTTEYEDGQESASAARVSECTLAAVSGLHRLTHLCFLSADGVLSPSTAPGFSSLSALQQLEMHCDAGIQLAVLRSQQQLRLLELWETPVRGAAELLAVLPQLQALTSLQLFCSLEDAAPPAQYSALLASSKLESLLLTGCVLPDGGWRGMFSGVAPSLTCLVANTLDAEPLDADDLRSLARACPNLAGLYVSDSVESGSDWSVLAPLQHLAGLRISHVSDDNTAKLVALPTVTSLTIVGPNGLSAIGMWQFVALQQLENLLVFGMEAPDDAKYDPYNARWCFAQDVDELEVSGALQRPWPEPQVGCLLCAAERVHHLLFAQATLTALQRQSNHQLTSNTTPACSLPVPVLL